MNVVKLTATNMVKNHFVEKIIMSRKNVNPLGF